ILIPKLKEIYQEELPVSLKIYEEGELVVENDYTVDFKAGIVREGVTPSLFTLEMTMPTLCPSCSFSVESSAGVTLLTF
ncbi:MAG: hypothetical protein UW16_C0018G0001, partial [Microgenomates group bacterium GW2011_GWC1_44_10]